MSNELDYSLGKFRDAIRSLGEGIERAKDDLGKDGVIQRFEFTFELLWKTLRIFLEKEGIHCRSPKDCLKAAFKFGLVQDEKAFLDMLDDRNLTSHIYHKDQSQAVFGRIKTAHLAVFQQVLSKLDTKA